MPGREALAEAGKTSKNVWRASKACGEAEAGTSNKLSANEKPSLAEAGEGCVLPHRMKKDGLRIAFVEH